ncbi:isochorismate synthase [Rhodococcus sp. D2-41]|uniref:isochorismate synthase n=1 Tax=Speluncibacter jeojiensis TaxID=2710754 RepID=UPI0024106FFB|nr:isochorismate synthase [Rhodococcus sp. D2-41]MDG3010259.1 isochorismate synthase [Rhodococcus sp. D2-41]
MDSTTGGGTATRDRRVSAEADAVGLTPGGFLLSRSKSTLCTSGVRDRYDDPAQARRALADGAPMIVGALPFDPHHPAALTVPETVARLSGPWRTDPLPPLPEVRLVGELPSAAEHLERVTALIERVRSGAVDKVVAARSVLLAADDPISPHALLARLISQDPGGNGFGVDLSAAGGDWAGRTLVGSSPEVLIRRHGRRVRCWPLAGSAPRHSEPEADEQEAARLLASAKNRHEHAFVVEWLRERLGPFCRELTVAPEPGLLGTPDVWHLGTPIDGVLDDRGGSALDLALAVHPTPAVCGTPTPAALAAIREVEEDRGFYAGAVGWCDANGDGDWMVAIRCAEISADGLRARAFAGGGIVAGSVPEDELAETSTKLRTLLSALGVPAN